MAYSLLNDLNQSSHKWKILVRLPRIWEFSNPRNSAQIYHLDFIMLDAQGNVMQGLVPERWLDKFTPLLHEGAIYEIEYFEVIEAKNSYQAVDKRNVARFSKYTKITKILPEPTNFPVYAYNSMTLSTLRTRIGKTALLSDTVVTITAVSPVTAITTRLGETVKRTINIMDNSETGIITLWGRHAQLFDAEALENISQNTPLVALFVGMLVNTYAGQLALQSSSATKWYINIPIPEVQSLRAAFLDKPHQIKWHEEPPAQPEPTTTTVRDLIQLIPNESLKQLYKTTIFIHSMSPNQTWWYISCSACWKKTYTDGDAYKCQRCGNTTAEPRYRINMIASDPPTEEDPDPPTTEFTFLGDTAQTLIGRPLMVLVAAAEQQTGYVPPEIQKLTKTQYSVVVIMSEGSLQTDIPTFRVRSILPTAQPEQPKKGKNKLLLLEGSSQAGSLLTHNVQAETPTELIHASPSTPPTASPIHFLKETAHDEALPSDDPQLLWSSDHPSESPSGITKKLKTAKQLFRDCPDSGPPE